MSQQPLIYVAFALLCMFSLHLTHVRSLRTSSHYLRPTRFYQTNRRVDPVSASASDAAGSSFYITTPIYYVNGLPHLGHAYTSVLSDIIARYQRKGGKDVFFLTGTDEHGQKVEQSAEKAGKSPQLFADEISAKFRDLNDRLGCSNNDFIRTTEERHKACVAKLWDRLLANGQIYLGAYEGWYAVRDEAYYTEEELVDGKAPTGAEVEWVKEESYFFRLSDYTDKLLQFYSDNPNFIGPRGRRNEVVSFVGQDGGLRDLSISRTTFSWGIPVPNDPKHVVYVWLDALTNYLSAVDYLGESEAFKKHWPAALHVVGKDILRFHAVFWPAFMMAAGLPLPGRIYAHGWWTRDGEKMSKSVGNVVDPYDLLDRYGLDYVRYFLCAEINFGNDGDFSDLAFQSRVNSDLANDIGNLAQRALSMIDKHCDGVVPAAGLADFTAEDTELLQRVARSLDDVQTQLASQNMKQVCEAVVMLAKAGNKYIDTQAPWKLLKEDRARMNVVLFVLAELLRVSAVLLEPVMPGSCARMLDQLGCPAELRSFASVQGASSLTAGAVTMAGCRIGTPVPIFPKIETESDRVRKAAGAGAGAAAVVGGGGGGGGGVGAGGSSGLRPPAKKSKAEKEADKLLELAARFPAYAGMAVADLQARVAEVGDSLREKKAEGVSKDDLSPLIDELTYAKARLQELSV